jgi:Skp family chaperone for outer membrane proteins
MKKLFYILILLCSVNVFAQREGREKIKALKIAYITENLELTSKEAEKFWPIYNKHEDIMYELRFVKMKSIKRKLKDQPLENMSDSEAAKMLKEFEDLENQFCNEITNMNAELKKVLSAKKILLLKKIEDDFNRQLLHRLKGKKDQ